MKNIINKLKNPELFYAVESPTNFLDEISDGTESLRVTKSFLNSFSRVRLETERQQRKTDIHFNIYTVTLLSFTGLLFYIVLTK